MRFLEWIGLREKHPEKEESKEKKTLMRHLREWADALVIAYILAMFIRTFVVELFKIPTGSMTPTLVGDISTEFDYDDNGEEDLVLLKSSSIIHVFFKENGEYVNDIMYRNPPRHKLMNREFKMRADKIMVDKSAYWLNPPKRGDIVVFKVPEQIYTPEKPVYIKRCIGLPGDEVEIQGGDVYINGEKLTGEPYDNIEYQNMCAGHFFTHTTVEPGHIFVLGDNSKSSLDSRAWGLVPLDNLRGRAILRYLPIKKISFLE